MKKSTPLAVSFVCVIGFIGCFLALLQIISPPVQQVGRWYAIYLSLGTIFTAICLGNIWQMRKKAVVAYTFYFLLTQGVYVAAHMWNETALLFPGLTVIVGWVYYRKME